MARFSWGPCGTKAEPEVGGRLLEALGKAGDGRILEALLALDLPEEEEAPGTWP